MNVKVVVILKYLEQCKSSVFCILSPDLLKRGGN